MVVRRIAGYAVGTIKINGNDKEFINLSKDRDSLQIKDKETSNREFKVNADLLKISEATPIKKIHNLP
jgi:hypothetical protein